MADVTLSFAAKIINPSKTALAGFEATIETYRKTIEYLIPIANQHWDEISTPSRSNEQRAILEKLVHVTKKNPTPKYGEFDELFPNLPSYLRRAALTAAIGDVSSWRSNHQNWVDAGRQGREPRLTKKRNHVPSFYRGNMWQPLAMNEAVEESRDTEVEDFTRCRIKLLMGNTWDWCVVSLRPDQARWLKQQSEVMERKAPILEKRGHSWFLRFAFEKTVTLVDEPVGRQRVVAVDLGVNTPATCCVMEPDGTIVARSFIDFPTERGRLSRSVNKLRKAQSKGSKRMPCKWSRINRLNEEISRKTARAIVDFAIEYSCTHVVFEHLGDIGGRKRGSRKWRLHLWRCRDVQARVERHAHLWGMRVSRVCAWGTSRLAFDGSGRVKRGSEIAPRGGVSFGYGCVEFTSGKLYSADLNAAYNVGARFFIREFLKALPVKVGSAVLAKVPRCSKRSSCVLSDLISLVKAIRVEASSGVLDSLGLAC